MNALVQRDMTPQAIRMAIIGALRLAGDAVCLCRVMWEGLHESDNSEDIYT